MNLLLHVEEHIAKLGVQLHPLIVHLHVILHSRLLQILKLPVDAAKSRIRVLSLEQRILDLLHANDQIIELIINLFLHFSLHIEL